MLVNTVRSPQDGLLWKDTIWGPEPAWTREPSISGIEAVSRQHLHIPPEEPCSVQFLAAGLFNKVYVVEAGQRTAVMRVTLPVYPSQKTRAEVATLQWVRDKTSVPVPEVFAFDDSNDNSVGFEWILMQHMHGKPARKCWRTLPMDRKIALAERVATFHLELSGLNGQGAAFTSIGTLDSPPTMDDVDLTMLADVVRPGPLVTSEFFMGSHLNYDIPRGPFASSHDWMSTVLVIIMHHQTKVIETATDEDDKEEAEEILAVAGKLRSLVPKAFPPNTKIASESTGLFHHDLNLNNILLDEQGQVTAVIDWECVSAMPIWLISHVPKFLEEEAREEQPRREEYADETPEQLAEAAQKSKDPDYLDNEGKNQLYWIHLLEYEMTQLRKVFRAKLKELCPTWPDEDPVKSDFYQAVCQCDGMWVGKAARWAERFEKGETVRFVDA